MDVDRIRHTVGAGIKRAREKAPAVAVGLDQLSERATRVVVAVVRLGRQHGDDPKVVARRRAQLLAQDLVDLTGPEELVLDVDQPLRRAKGADVRLENAEIPTR